jgi:hypothetical protein
MRNSPVALASNHGLESLEDLNRRLETDGSRRHVNLASRLSHDRPDQVVGQAVLPDLPADTFWRLAA